MKSFFSDAFTIFSKAIRIFSAFAWTAVSLNQHENDLNSYIEFTYTEL